MHSIQWKIVLVFVLLVVSIMLVVGTFLLNTVPTFYTREFKIKMDSVFDNDFIGQMTEIVALDDLEKDLSKMDNMLKSFGGALGINSFRNYYILDGTTAGILISSNSQGDYIMDKSPNIIAALNGKLGNQINHEKLDYMDFAVPITVGGQVKYIAYVKDNKYEIKNMTSRIFDIILRALLLGVSISIIMGFFLSRTITAPIAHLTKEAQKIGSGDFRDILLTRKTSKDEIGILRNTFNSMAVELKNTLNQISNEKNKVETILTYMADGVMAFDSEGKPIHINPTAHNMLRKTLEADDNIEFDSFFKRLNVDISLGFMFYIPHSKTIARLINSEGKHIQAFFAVFDNQDGSYGGIVTVFHDVTQQQQLEELRREFVANVSHELRTPLTTVKSYTETLLDGMLGENESSHFLEVINTEVDRMTRLVKDLLSLSGLNHQQINWNKKLFSLRVLVEKILENVDLEVKKFRHEITLCCADNLPDVYGDTDRIQQVITNVVSNAIKYTPPGGKISIDISFDHQNVFIKTIDNGIGIPEKDLERIFERFYRVDKARSRELGGTGLGLAIAKEIVVAHGGDITMKSKQGVGSEVSILFPLPR